MTQKQINQRAGLPRVGRPGQGGRDHLHHKEQGARDPAEAHARADGEPRPRTRSRRRSTSSPSAARTPRRSRSRSGTRSCPACTRCATGRRSRSASSRSRGPSRSSRSSRSSSCSRASTILIANTIRLSIFARRREIEVMKLVGATNWFVRGPFMLEGLLTGLAGSLAAVRPALPRAARSRCRRCSSNIQEDPDVHALAFRLDGGAPRRGRAHDRRARLRLSRSVASCASSRTQASDSSRVGALASSAVAASSDLERGREAHERRAWRAAYDFLSSADAAAPLEADDLELLATSAYMLGRDSEFEACLERAHHAYLDAGEPLLPSAAPSGVA